MALIGEVFVADILGKTVLDPRGEEIGGAVRDIAVEAGVRFPRAVGLSSKEEVGALPAVGGADDLQPPDHLLPEIGSELSENGGEYGPPVHRPGHPRQTDRRHQRGEGRPELNDVKRRRRGEPHTSPTWTSGCAGSCGGSGIEHRGNASSRRSATRCATSSSRGSSSSRWSTSSTSHAVGVARGGLRPSPADLAQIMSGPPPGGAAGFFRSSKPRRRRRRSRARARDPGRPVRGARQGEGRRIIEQMQPVEAADVIADLPTEKAQELLSSWRRRRRRDIHELLHHEDDTAGGVS